MKYNNMYFIINQNELDDGHHYDSLKDAIESMKKRSNSKGYGYKLIVKVEKIYEVNVTKIDFKEII